MKKAKNNRCNATNINSGSRLVKSPLNDLILTQTNENVHSFVENNLRDRKKPRFCLKSVRINSV